ncbi:hypothetical protein KWAN_155 [Erwinia phage vB_EamM_Kwan]|uniref:Uncharacterized protein n=1 Tax=Erwinia phage vB_EamM_Kwan TaxID=1883374 RepID=A0A1B2IDZ4_9CAUD|nr:hypothetical protein BIZ80_gp144 [Erwinia phage vB_EamM_Kwan]ANZ49507.1 hypothetical protein KWAN_155 [Erwinia phage vB_EamM_Kwan]
MTYDPLKPTNNPIMLIVGIVIGLLQLIWMVIRLPVDRKKGYDEMRDQLIARCVDAEVERDQLRVEVKSLKSELGR